MNIENGSMANRIFIIDDNHSQVDSIKVMLQDIPLQYESAFRFQEARNKLETKGAFFNQAHYNQLEYLVQEIEKQPEVENEKDEKIKNEEIETLKQELEDPFNEEGICLILVEHDTENNTKGMDFIQNMLQRQDAWTEKDFVLMTSRPELVQKKAQDAGVFVLEKPIQYDVLKQVILQKIKTIQENQEKVKSLMEKLSLKSFPSPDKTTDKPTKRRTRSPKKTSS